MLNQIWNAIDPHLRENKESFCVDWTTLAQVLALRRKIEKVKKNNLIAVLHFIDFKKAFKSIHRGAMMEVMKTYCVPPNLLRAIESMYAETRAKVVTTDNNTVEFNILAGVLYITQPNTVRSA